MISYQQKNPQAPSVYIYDAQGTLVFPYDLTQTEKDALPDYLQAVDSSSETTIFTDPSSGQKNILVSETASGTGWTYLTVQPESIVLAPVVNLQKLLLLAVAVMLAVSAYLSWILSKSLLLPIRSLQTIITQTELETLGHNTTRPLGTSIDELEDLNLAFQDMSTKLKTSMDQLLESRQQELKSRSLALQSQINPHFYYNTLSSIIVLAENGQSEEVITLCRNLTKIMRYITNSHGTDVAIREELDYIRQYSVLHESPVSVQFKL